MDWTFFLFWGMIGLLIGLIIIIGKGGGNIGSTQRKVWDQYANYWKNSYKKR